MLSERIPTFFSVAMLGALCAGNDVSTTVFRGLFDAAMPTPAFAGSRHNEQSQEQVRQQQQEQPRTKDGQTSTEQDKSRTSLGENNRSTEGGDQRSTNEKSRNGTADRPTSGDDKLPGTIAEWLQRLSKAAPVPAADGNKPPNTTTGGSNRRGGRMPLPLPLSQPELLAINLSKANIDRAVNLGFTPNGSTEVSRLGLGVTRLIAPAGMNAQMAQELLRQALPDEAIEVNQKYRIYKTATGSQPQTQTEAPRDAKAMATPCGNDRCFGAAAIKWQPQLQDCARSTRIGVIDTGYDSSHPTFHARSIEVRRQTPKGLTRAPDWHGTGVLALLAGDPRSNTPGLIPDAKYFVADIFYADGDGQPASDTASLLEALDWLEKKNVNIVNLSLAGPHDELLKRAIAGLSGKGILFVAAAGNDGPTAPPSYPAAYSPVIAVTAVGADMRSYRHASRGDHIDFAAPGVDIWTALPGGQAGYHSGTSFAVPFVTAVLASLLNELPEKSKVEFLKRATVIDLGAHGHDPIYGNGLLLAPASCKIKPDGTATAAHATVAKNPVLPVGTRSSAKTPGE